MDGHRELSTLDLESGKLRILPVAEGSVLIVEGDPPRARTLERMEIEPFRERQFTLLGRRNELTYASVTVDPEELREITRDGSSRVVTVRSAGQMLDRSEAAIVAYANALSSWQKRSAFCGSCGAPAHLEHSGHRRRCSSSRCETIQFPRTDPSVIGIVSCGEECLLVNQPQWAQNRFATVAGFVEPGESLEEAMAREIWEETGLVASTMRYHSSQPWPFPMSLMIGCFAEATTHDIVIDRTELEDARWFSKDEVTAMLLRRHDDGLTTPPPMAIAHHIIRAWLNGACAFD
jgi:NAD+ diphosphatase